MTSIGDGAFANCSSLKGSLRIPNSVTSIGSSAFSGCTGLTSITIPNSVTNIDNFTFSGCSGLNSITIPSSVTSIGSDSFAGCSGLNSITIPESVATINNYTFAGCSGLTSISIPNSVTSISDYAFQGCSGLNSVIIGNSVTNIGNGAFKDCTSLPSISIPNSVTSINKYAFEDCSNLTSVTITSNTIASNSYDSSSTLTSIFGSQVTEYIFGDDVQSIGQYACYNSPSLTKVCIGSGMKNIGLSAFQDCSNLNEVEFSSIESLCNIQLGNTYSNPLYYSHHLYIDGSEVENLVLPDELTTIDSRFQRCVSFSYVSIPASVTTIVYNAFERSSLTSTSERILELLIG